MAFYVSSGTFVLALALVATQDRSGPPGQSGNPRGDAAAARAIVESYKKNREYFDNFKCDYHLVQARSKSIRDAQEGRFIDAETRRHRLTVRGVRVKYEEFCDGVVELPGTEALGPIPDGKAVAQGRPGRTVSIKCLPAGYLSDGSYKLYYSRSINAANLFAPGHPTSGVEISPFSLGVMGINEDHGPSVEITTALDRGFDVSVDGPKDLDGSRVVEITVRSEKLHVRRAYAFDVEHGFFPVRMSYTDTRTGRENFTTYTTHFRKVGDDHWFPERSVVVWKPDEREQTQIVHEIKVVGLEVDGEERPEDFQLTLLKNTHISISKMPRSEVVIDADTIYTPKDLESLYKKCMDSNDKRSVEP